MKRYFLFLISVFFVCNVYAEGVVLSEISVAEEEPLYTSSNSSSVSKSEQLMSEQIGSANPSLVSNDSSDPLFLVSENQFLSDTSLFYVDDKMRLGQYFGYGVNNRLMLHANMVYQIDFSGHEEYGFSSTEFGADYRLMDGAFSKSHIIADALFGLKLWGASHVRTPEYADSSYYAGLRFGRQFFGMTLSGTVKSTWVFDDERGVSYIDFIPEAYFRFKYDWRAGVGFDLRKSTNRYLLENQEWLNFKLLRQYGNTQYVGHFDYEFESNEIKIGADVKILF